MPQSPLQHECMHAGLSLQSFSSVLLCVQRSTHACGSSSHLLQAHLALLLLGQVVGTLCLLISFSAGLDLTAALLRQVVLLSLDGLLQQTQLCRSPRISTEG